MVRSGQFLLMVHRTYMYISNHYSATVTAQSGTYACTLYKPDGLKWWNHPKAFSQLIVLHLHILILSCDKLWMPSLWSWKVKVTVFLYSYASINWHIANPCYFKCWLRMTEAVEWDVNVHGHVCHNCVPLQFSSFEIWIQPFSLGAFS
jgi:hypothetical protein